MIARLTALALVAAALFAQPAAAKGYIAVTTRQAGPMIAWYKLVFGLAQVRTVRPQGANLTVTVLDGPLATVEIMSRADMLTMNLPPERRIGIFKTGFAVDDLDALLLRWKQAGIAVAAGPFEERQPPSRAVVLSDPDGNLIQVFAPVAAQ